MRISLAQSHQLLYSGHVVAVPTETVYGLAASLERPGAIDQIFSLKKRPLDNPLIIHVADPGQALMFSEVFPDDFDALTEAFWPGPLTLVLPVETDSIPSRARAGLPTAAFRMPNHSLTLALLKWVGPLVMPSANLSGRPSATRPDHVELDFGLDFPVLDGGPCGHGIESTILYWDKGIWKVVRLGALPAQVFAPILGYVPELDRPVNDKSPICPGQLHRHYAPRAELKLTQEASQCEGVVVGFSDREYRNAARVMNLGSSDDPEAVASSLYAVLRLLDQENIMVAWVDFDIPQDGLWQTIHERLHKAANK